MANTKSSKKRIDINKRNRLQNKYYKTSVRTLIKLFFKNLEIYNISKNLDDKKRVHEILSLIYCMMDKGIKKNIFHKNMVARKKSKLACYLKKA
uniref:Small ribosomal subunit protein bS20c n=1 Tax=Cylindrotheca closterium TaxID=2856 RepID=A0A023HBN5_9STRA|nr:ribosomal protein S20 [Cylindrotheca closterium]AGH28548.1 ribosomal protein S20 [Cylindrotheca closterium]